LAQSCPVIDHRREKHQGSNHLFQAFLDKAGRGKRNNVTLYGLAGDLKE
jgi:hypothetical protein